jgi:anaerobic selenocysteine-containing dehydrogenase
MKPETRIVRSSCRMCHGVCQVQVHLEGDRVVKVTGDPESPISSGYLCPKGKASPELLYHPDRLTHPIRRVGTRGENRWERVSWAEAIDEIVERFDTIRKESGSEYLALVTGTGRPYIQMSLRFANAVGTPNFVAPGHLCYLPRQVASRATLGQLPVADIYGHGGVMPACIVVWGCDVVTNAASDGMAGGPFLQAVRKAQKVIVVDPRRTGLARRADQWLQLRPGTDGALALAMIHVIIDEDRVDHDFVDNYTEGFDELALHVREFTPEWAASITRVPADAIRAAARTYATTRPACIQWGQGVDASACNFQTARSLLILRALTGNVDVPGGDVQWLPQEGVKNVAIFNSPEHRGEHLIPPEKRARMLSAGRFASNLSLHPPTFWETVISGSPYRVRGVWILGSNPLMTGTQGRKIERALKDHVEFTVASDFFLTPTTQLADLVLPAATWLEQDDVAFVHKIWCVLARRKVAQVGEVRDDREVLIDVARRLGLEKAFPWKNLREYQDWVLEDTGLDFDAFCERGALVGTQRFRKYETKGFETPSGKLELKSRLFGLLGLAPLPEYREPPLSPQSTPELAELYPLILITGVRTKPFFHSELRQIPALRRANPDPLVEIHPDTAHSLGIADGDWIWIETPVARVQLKARLWKGVAPDVVSAQHAWWFPEAGPPDYDWQRSNVNLLFGDTGFDPETGSEPLKSALCRVYPVSPLG